MNAGLPSFPAIGDRLTREGWRASARRPGRWRRDGPAGRAAAEVRPQSSGWYALFLSGGSLPSPVAADALRANAVLAGPCKFVCGADGRTVCRADLSRAVLAGDDAMDAAGAWAKSLTALVGGPAAPEPPAWKPEELAPLLEADGWAASAGDGAVRVSVALPGLFRQIVVAAGTRMRCELVDLHGWPDVCVRAAVHLAAAANDRLRLVRFVLEEGETARSLAAEVHLACLPVPSPCLDVALQAMHTAVALTARELSALKGDPELANRCLTAAAVGRKEV
ncbi:MAG TPA: hypothetical protein VMS17_04445 [Gemmataceae bacterium]|nr:hypothetical protein [Gemmataceae bacterium]